MAVPIRPLSPPLNEPPMLDEEQFNPAWPAHFVEVTDQINALQGADAAFWAALAAGPSYANDAAAAVGLVPIGSRYRNGSVVMVRVV